MKNEVITTLNNRAITVIESKAKVGDIINIKMLNTKNSIYIGKEI